MFLITESLIRKTSVFKETVIVFLFFFLLVPYSKAQLIINEVSQGPSGAKEYVELLVVGTPSCNSIPCLDLRGYYIDDNNGAQATGTGTGIAQGCLRFKNTSFWSCVPIGTLIVIYNDGDPNPNIPSDDLSMTDGNCKLVIPASNCSLLEMNTDFPSLSSASFPTSGFSACGDWAALAMANGDDSFQTVSPSGVSVFSVSWGNNTSNPLIYFSGTSAASVSYMANTVDNDPNNQFNWTRASATGNETPGAPNNTSNAAWISAMNNSCSPISPLAVTVTPTNPGCACNGSISANATGGPGSYSYSWAPSGGTNATASGLCAGTYTVTVTTGGGCSQTATATLVASAGALNIIVNSETICSGQSATLSATGATDYVWSTGAITNSITESPVTTTSYTVTGTSNGCTGIGTGTITVGNALPVSVNSETICSGQSATLTATGATDYVWSTGAITNSITEAPVATTSYTVTGTSNGCTGIGTGTITVGNALPVSVNSETICSGQSATLTATGGTDYIWSTGATTHSITLAPAATTSYTVTGTSNGCSGTATGVIVLNALPSVVFGANILTGCQPFCSDFTDTSSVSGGSVVSWHWDFGDGNASDLQQPQHCFNTEGNYTVTLIVASNAGCIASATATNMIQLKGKPFADFDVPDSRTIIDPVISFTDNSTGADTWSWNFGDVFDSLNNSSIAVNPAHAYSVAGDYCVSLMVTNNASGCADTALKCFAIDSEYTFYLPNTFSPNGDGLNDEFYGKGEGILEFQITIFDRWGGVVFMSSDINEHWDGKPSKGTRVSQQESYVYDVIIRDTKRERHQYTGSIVIAR